jgi:hypothetical protein
MAPDRSGAAVGLAHRNDYMETKPLKLGAENIPFPCSLLELVLDRYAEPPGIGSNPHPMQLDELLEYLESIDNFNLSPWVAIVGQTEAIGDPATPSRSKSPFCAGWARLWSSGKNSSHWKVASRPRFAVSSHCRLRLP